MVTSLLPTRQYFALGNKSLPARGNRSLQTIDEAGFAQWRWDWTMSNKLPPGNYTDGSPVFVQGDDAIVSSPWNFYDGIGEYIPTWATPDSFAKSSRRRDVWCLLDYTIVNTNPGGAGIWPLLMAVEPGNFARNIMTLRPGLSMIRDQQTGPFFDVLSFTNDLDARRNKLLINIFYYSADVKAIAVMGWDRVLGRIVGILYPMWEAIVPGSGTWLPVFGINPREDMTEGYFVIHDFQISDTQPDYGSPPL